MKKTVHTVEIQQRKKRVNDRLTSIGHFDMTLHWVDQHNDAWSQGVCACSAPRNLLSVSGPAWGPLR